MTTLKAEIAKGIASLEKTGAIIANLLKLGGIKCKIIVGKYHENAYNYDGVVNNYDGVVINFKDANPNNVCEQAIRILFKCGFTDMSPFPEMAILSKAGKGTIIRMTEPVLIVSRALTEDNFSLPLPEVEENLKIKITKELLDTDPMFTKICPNLYEFVYDNNKLFVSFNPNNKNHPICLDTRPNTN